MSEANSDKEYMRLIRERKVAREQIAGLKAAIQRTGADLAAIGKQMVESPDDVRLDVPTFSMNVAQIPDFLAQYQKAVSENEDRESAIAAFGLDY